LKIHLILNELGGAKRSSLLESGIQRLTHSAMNRLRGEEKETVSIHQIPPIYQDLVELLSLKELTSFGEGNLQFLLVETVLEGKARSVKELKEFILKEIKKKNEQSKSPLEPSQVYQVLNETALENENHIEKMLERYNQRMDSKGEVLKRKFQSPHEWKQGEIEKFHEAYKKYGHSGPNNNRKIAEFIGNDVHPRHVSFLKMQIHREEKKRKLNHGEYSKPVNSSCNICWKESCKNNCENLILRNLRKYS